MADIPFPRGVRDLMPNEARFRNEFLKRVEDSFQRFGFLSIDTPTFEPLKLLNSKNSIGEDAKLIFEIKDQDLGLRYDHTVSLARYMGMHQELPLPFKRYYIGKAWRRDEPQRLRYWEFTQADIDIVGGTSPFTDAEVIGAASTALESVGIDHYVDINDRALVDAVIEKFGVNAETVPSILRIIDKLDKIGEDKVADMLRALKLSNEIVDQIMSFIALKGSNNEKLDYVDALLGSNGKTAQLRGVLELVSQYGLKSRIVVNFSVVRGLDYYTGLVWEYKSADRDVGSSIGGGGRYDRLIGLYSGKQMPAVGTSFGIDKLLFMLDYSKSPDHTYAKAFVATVKDSNYAYALKVANRLRASGIGAEINLATRNLSHQFAYANSLKFRYALIIGDAEEKANNVKIRNLDSGDEQSMGIEETIKTINGN